MKIMIIVSMLFARRIQPLRIAPFVHLAQKFDNFEEERQDERKGWLDYNLNFT